MESEDAARLRRVLDAAGVGHWEWAPAERRFLVDDRLAGWLGARPATLDAYRALTGLRERQAEGVDVFLVGGRWLEERRIEDGGRTVGACRDVTDDRRRAERLAWQAAHDPLTGLLHRRAFDDVLEEVIGRDAGAGPVLLMLDLDGFKRVNDRFGHDAGDRALRAVAGRLRGALRRDDPLCRWGGDEFSALLPAGGTGLRGALVARRLVEAVRPPLPLDEEPVEVRVSAGVAVHRPGEGPASLVRRADRALYHAKVSGGDRWALAGEPG